MSRLRAQGPWYDYCHTMDIMAVRRSGDERARHVMSCHASLFPPSIPIPPIPPQYQNRESPPPPPSAILPPTLQAPAPNLPSIRVPSPHSPRRSVQHANALPSECVSLVQMSCVKKISKTKRKTKQRLKFVLVLDNDF
ncbi:hypothetical protein L249_6256, partial [Ophiocordyceps polyrhachis-furcata BCC 54312]